MWLRRPIGGPREEGDNNNNNNKVTDRQAGRQADR